VVLGRGSWFADLAAAMAFIACAMATVAGALLTAGMLLEDDTAVRIEANEPRIDGQLAGHVVDVRGVQNAVIDPTVLTEILLDMAGKAVQNELGRSNRALELMMHEIGGAARQTLGVEYGNRIGLHGVYGHHRQKGENDDESQCQGRRDQWQSTQVHAFPLQARDRSRSI
jgi:hypothetical protein